MLAKQTPGTRLLARAFAQALAALAGPLLLLAGNARAAIVASNDLAVTPHDQSVLISPLTNDLDDADNRLAILQVTLPAHGTVTVCSNAAFLTPQLSNLFQFAAFQLSNSVVQVNKTNLYPRRTLPNGTWSNTTVNDWIGGFFPGSMWYIYEQTGDTNFLRWARQWTAGISARQFDTSTDDIGFMINTSFGNGYRLTGDTNYLAVLTNGAHTLANRYNSVVRCIADDRTLPPPTFEVILDTMMNGDLLYRVADLVSNTNFSSRIFNHQLRAMTNQIRPDNSTYHLADYSTATGGLTYQGTRAGYTNWSTWARGHAWAIYMFTRGYSETGCQPFLDAAQRVAGYYISNAPPDYVPYWDFQAPHIPDEPKDSSAAAITLSGLLQLSQVTTNLTNAAQYWAEANNIFQSLASTNYLAQGTSNSSILLHGVGETPVLAEPETNVGLIYGDYYFVESMRRYALAYGRTNLIYTPQPGFTGADSFTCLVCDSAGNCSTDTVTVVVQPSNAPPPFNVAIVVPPAAPGVEISFPTTAGYLYDVQYRDDIIAGGWVALATNLVGNDTTNSVPDPSPPATRYYRVLAR